MEFGRFVEDGTFDFPKFSKIDRTVVHNSFHEERKFVHDTMLCVFDGVIRMAWYSCPHGEITDDTMIIGRASRDDAKTWSEPFVIAGDDGRHGEVRHYVPVSFAAHQGRLYAFVSSMTRHDRPVSTGLYRLGEGETWEYVTDIVSEADDTALILNSNMLHLPDGRLLMSGRMHPQKNQYPDRPCVLFSDTGDVTQWRIVPLTDGPLGNCPETSVTLTAEGRLIAVTRNCAHEKSVFFVSDDLGATWRRAENTLPVTDSKLYIATLSNGKTVAAFNCAPNGKDRTRLCLGVLNTQTLNFDSVRTVAHGMTEAGDHYAYPCIAEKDGGVFVSCTVHLGDTRSAAVFRIGLEEI